MESNFLVIIFALLAASAILVPIAKSLGFGTILGYLAAGILIGPYGLGLIADSENVRHVSEFGVVIMLFLIGLELQPLELWRMRDKLLGMGLTQVLITALLVGGAAYFMGQHWQVAVIIGLALSMSSTAIALQLMSSRGITHHETGRASLSVLLLQDVAVIPILTLIPLLATKSIVTGEEIGPKADWLTAAQVIGVFVFAILAARFVIRPLMRLVAMAGVREAFTALGLAIVIGAALLMEWIGFSAALGAFMGGVLLADSEYRHELESVLDPFKGLLLGLFFITVGTSIAFSLVAAQPLLIIGLVLGLVVTKALVLFALTSIFKMHIADRILLTFMLSQAGEFALVLFQFAESSGSMTDATVELMTVVVALSMAVTPFLIFGFDRFIAPRLYHPHGKGGDDTHDEFDQNNKVIVLGYGRFGQIVTRLLRSQGFEMTLIDDDPAQIETMKRFGVKVFFGDGSRQEILRAAGAGDAELIVIALPGQSRITDIARMIKRHFPKAKIAARAMDRSHAQDLMELGVEAWERETFKGALSLGTKALVTLGYRPAKADRIARSFEDYDTRILEESLQLRHDDDAYMGFLRTSTDMLDSIMHADMRDFEASEEADPAPQSKVDKTATKSTE